jgi:hypothetical protein
MQSPIFTFGKLHSKYVILEVLSYSYYQREAGQLLHLASL